MRSFSAPVARQLNRCEWCRIRSSSCLANLGPPIGISIGTNSDRELGDSAGFLRRGEKSLNRRSYRRAALIDETPRPPMLRTATRDKDPISTSRNRKGFSLSPPSTNILIRYLRRKAARPHPRRISFARSIQDTFYSLHTVFYLSISFLSSQSTSSILSIFFYRRDRHFSQLNLLNYVCDRNLNLIR